MITFFEISTLEMWPDMMFRAIDSQGFHMGPKINHRPWAALVFVVFIFITTFFIMNLFVSVIVDKFNEEIRKKLGAYGFNDEQKEWVKMQRIMVTVNVRVKPIEPDSPFRKHFFKLVDNDVFEYFIVVCILINTLFLCMEYYGSSGVYLDMLDIGNYFFVFIFLLEAVFKLIGFGPKYYWHVNWNKFDFIIVILSLFSLDEDLFSFNITALRIIRVARLLRMIRASKGLRHLLKTLWLSLSNIINVGMLLFLMLFTFSVAGMDLFGEVEFQNYINENANFRSFYKSMATLIRAATGESWNGLMHDCQRDAGLIAIFFWIAFIIIASFIFVNVFIAVIYENFNDIKSSEDANEVLSLKRRDIKEFLKTWAEFDKEGSHYMRTSDFKDFLRQLPPPLGYKNISIEESKLNKIIFCLNIRDHKGKVYFPEVMWAIFHSIIGNNDEKVHKCEQVQTIMRQLKRKYKHLDKNVTPDSLCGNKFYKKEITVSKYMSAMKIYQRMKHYKKLKENQRRAAQNQPESGVPLIAQSPDKSQNQTVRES